MQNKKLLSFLLALLVSVGIWVYVVTVENPEGEDTIYNVPVIFSGDDVLREDYDLVITEDNVSVNGVSLTFSGKRTDLKKLSEMKNEMYVTIDVVRIRNVGEYRYSYTLSDVTLPASVSSGSVQLSDRSPSSVSLSVGRLKKKTVPVAVVTDVSLAEGFMQQPTLQNYDEIVIEGPENLIEQITSAQVRLERENVEKTITATLPFALMTQEGTVIVDDSITCNVDEIEVTLPVLMTKDVVLEVGFVDGGGATSEDVNHSIDPVKVTLSGDSSVLSSVSSIKLPNIALSSLMSNSEEVTCVIPVPEGCTNVSGIDSAVVTVTISNKSIRSLKATNIQIINVPEGMEAVSKTTVLPVVLRANASDADKLSVENIRVVADLSTVTIEGAGAITVPVTVYVDGMENVGAIGPQYSIVVELTT